MENTNNTMNQTPGGVNKKKILSIVLNSVIWIFVAFSLLITILVFSAQGSKDGVPSVFGKSLITISSDSMEPIYYIGDLVFMTKLTDAEKAELTEGQIITFISPIDINEDGIIGNDLNTHIIYEADHARNTFITQGKNNPHPDNVGENGYEVHYSDVIGVCTEKGRIGGVGNVISFLRSSLGFFLCIVLPLVLFFLYELYNFITILVTERQKKATAGAAAVDEEEIKRRAIEEYLAKQQNEEEIKRRAIEEYLANEASDNNKGDES